ncbi:MAG: YidH family protein [Gammaproteobacteria bacterium]
MPASNDPRVLLAAERTLLAWDRTSVALIGLGFLIERSSLLKAGDAQAASAPMLLSSTFVIGLGFIVAGVLAVLVAWRQFRRVLTSLDADEIPAGYNAKSAALLNLLVGGLGFALGAAMFFDQG